MRNKRMLAIVALALIVFAPVKSIGQLIRDFVVSTDQAVSAGDVVVLINNEIRAGSPEPAPGLEYVFNSEGTYDISITSLSETKFVVVYRDGGNSDYGTAVVGEVSGRSITFGAERVFNNASTDDISVARLSESKFVIAYRDADHGAAVVGEVSGNSIILGWEEVFNSESTNEISVAGLSGTKFIVTYQDGGNADHGTAVVGEVTGDAISFSSQHIFNSAGTSYISAAALSETKFVVAYRDVGDAHKGMALLGQVTNTSITFGSESVFRETNASSIAVAALSGAKFVIVYQSYSEGPIPGTSHHLGALGEVSGSSIAFSSLPYLGVHGFSALSETKVAFTYPEIRYLGLGGAIGDLKGFAKVGIIWGSSVVYGLESVFDWTTPTDVCTAGLSSTEFVIAYRDSGNADSGTAIVSDIGGVTLGIADAAAAGGQSVPVIIQGISGHHSGLVPGMIYYVQPDWSLTPETAGIRIGIAVSPTELLLDVER